MLFSVLTTKRFYGSWFTLRKFSHIYFISELNVILTTESFAVLYAGGHGLVARTFRNLEHALAECEVLCCKLLCT